MTRYPAARRAAGIVAAAVGLLSVLAISNGMPWPHLNDLSVRLLTQTGAGQPAVMPLPDTTGLAASVALLLAACVMGCWYWRRKQIEQAILLLLGMTGLFAIIAHAGLEVTQIKGGEPACISLRSALPQVALLLFTILVMGVALVIILRGKRIRRASPQVHGGPSVGDKPHP
jgi:hypothetical protein